MNELTKAIELIKAEINDFESNFMSDKDSDDYSHDIGFVAGLHRAKLLLRLLQSMNIAPDWIPCSEKLPDNDDWVLSTVRYWDKAEDPIDAAYYVVERLFYDEKWRIAGGTDVEQYDDAKVLAWMPLPAPYKERNL
jgi:hypothetical protein